MAAFREEVGLLPRYGTATSAIDKIWGDVDDALDWMIMVRCFGGMIHSGFWGMDKLLSL